MSNAITTISQSLLQTTQAQCVFSRMPNTVFELQKTVIPGFEINVINQATPFVNLGVPGNKVNYEPLVITFLLDEGMAAWYDVYNWLIALGRPVSGKQYANLAATAPPHSVGIRPPYSDATLTIYTAKNNPSQQFQFSDCFPTQLSSVLIDYSSSAAQILTATATFKYTTYTPFAINT